MQIKEAKFHNKNTSVFMVEKADVNYCPPKEFSSISLHPRVALKFYKGEASCPYCGTKFRYKKP